MVEFSRLSEFYSWALYGKFITLQMEPRTVRLKFKVLFIGMKHMTDDQSNWIEGLKAGSKEVLTDRCGAYYAELVSYCLRYVHDQDVAEDIVQDMFVKMWLRHADLQIPSFPQSLSLPCHSKSCAESSEST